MSRAIRKARSSFVPPAGHNVKIGQIRSHSARHRCINDLKGSGVAVEVGKKFARIASDKVYNSYGKLTEEQAKEQLAGNKPVQDLWSELCEDATA